MEAYRTQYAHFTINFPTKTMMDKKSLLTFANETHLIVYKCNLRTMQAYYNPTYIYIYNSNQKALQTNIYSLILYDQTTTFSKLSHDIRLSCTGTNAAYPCGKD